MSRTQLWTWVGVVCVVCAAAVYAQQDQTASDGNAANSSAVAAVPRLIKFSGAVRDARGEPLTGVAVRLTFSVYEEPTGGAALWVESQVVQLDEQGHYTVLLGATRADGLPVELFPAGKARWLGVQVEGSDEDSRVLLVSVPYALKAEDAAMLGGRQASDFVLGEQLKEEVRTQVAAQTPGIATQAVEMLTGNPPNVPAIVDGPSTFTCAMIGDCVTVTQYGAGRALRATATSVSEVVLLQQNGTGYGLRALALGNVALYGQITGSAGTSYGVKGQTTSTTGAGVFGYNLATTGLAYGILGQTSSTSGTALFGRATSTTGATIGLRGHADSTSGTGILGQATATSGTTTGILGRVFSAAGTALIVDNTQGGKLLSGKVGSLEKFSVDGGGNVYATGVWTGSRGVLTVATGTPPLTVNSTTLVPNLNADQLDGVHAGSLATLGTNLFVGNQSVTGNLSLTGAISSTGLRTEPTSGAPNIIGGFSGNSITSGVVAATISGGGEVANPNRVTDHDGTIGGGVGNQAGDDAGTPDDACCSTVGGGVNNKALGGGSTIGGGANNVTNIAGGGWTAATIAGGYENRANAWAGTVGGGQNNTASSYADTVAGGVDNTASGGASTVSGGNNNVASAWADTVGGGTGNTASGLSSTVSGGEGNVATEWGATVPGGVNNTARMLSFAAGRRAKAVDGSSFVWGDGTDADVTSAGSNSFVVRASGGFRFITGVDGAGNPQTTVSFDGGSGNIAMPGSVTAVSFAGDGSGLTNVTAGSANDLTCTGCVSPPELDFDPATHTELDAESTARASGDTTLSGALDTHKGSGDHDGRYARLDIGNSFTNTQTIASGDLSLSSGNISLPTTTSASVGVINLGGPFIHLCCGDANTFIGRNAGNFTSTGYENTASGASALQANTTGHSNTANGSGALQANTTGFLNTASGEHALYINTTGSGNTALGQGGGVWNTTGSNNTFIGYGAGPDIGHDALTNATAIGANAVVTASNALVLGGTGGDAVNVGIGTTAPAATLDVVGNIRSSGSVTATSFVGPLSGIASDLDCAGCVSPPELDFDPATQTELETESTARAAADTALQTNINAKVSKAGDTMTGTLYIGGPSTPNASLSVWRTGEPVTMGATHGLYVENSTPMSPGSSTVKYGAFIINLGEDHGNNSIGTAIDNYSTNTTSDVSSKIGLVVRSLNAFNGTNTGLIVRVGDAEDNHAASFEGGDVTISGGNLGIGTDSPGRELEVNGGVRLNTTTPKPTCDSTTRGTFWVTLGDPGAADLVEVCTKDAADAYAWRNVI